MKRFFVTLALSATIAGTGFAMTEGVENEAVKVRMMLMDGVRLQRALWARWPRARWRLTPTRRARRGRR